MSNDPNSDNKFMADEIKEVRAMLKPVCCSAETIDQNIGSVLIARAINRHTQALYAVSSSLDSIADQIPR